MFDEYLQLLYPFHLWLLLYLFIKQDITFAVPQIDIGNINSKDIDTNEYSPVSVTTWIQLKMNLGKDHLNAYHSRKTRPTIMKATFIMISSILILLSVGGIISIIVYYVKKE
ncbi:unnamed protein product [Rotaria sordida]|uniref:Uncharacterized protein n=1 Tax=Rotaria sordida TaxID=392033 RepID=A0A814Q4D1_9BILA|nr:unnamed protein product [Rotaria sordida]CAF0966963.1 unnamed protein product [Rotaria sordida]CAF1114369.1 unnamed protein product [Rotaria sordida]CAF3490095.1 unnamed protein product [Rotaria sordida]CAF3698485.1 unnamed protein product [Rotaria sordida]